MPAQTIGPNLASRVRLQQFDSTIGSAHRRSRTAFAAWYLIKCAFFFNPFPWPSSVRTKLLRSFGAKVGERITFKPRANPHFPWNLAIGDDSWIGEEVLIVNFEEVSIGANCCISQRAFLCTGNHDFTRPDFAYRNRPIHIKDGAWIGAQCFVGPGVTVGTDTVVTAGSVVTKDLPPGMICSGNPCLPIRPRWKTEGQGI